MLSSIRGLVLGFSANWKPAGGTKYKKILLGFPNEGIDNLWCTVFGEENWGYTHDSLTVNMKPIRLKSGLLIEVTGKFETRHKIKVPDINGRSFVVQSMGSLTGGFQVVQEVREHKVITIPGRLAKSLSKSIIEIRVENAKGVKYAGQIEYNSTMPVHSWNGLVIDGNPLVTGLDEDGESNEFYFDSDSEGKVLAYGRIPPASEAWRAADAPSGKVA